ncbi:alpha/beta hydrolase [Paraburkholderia sp.]|uniref:alpha/beta hydrolase n=1 Tax=Paraburkholderia sp. TaxID=1926495 RepID=UPI003D6F44EF
MTGIFHRDDERAPNERPVPVVAPQRIAVETAAGSGTVPLFASSEQGVWDALQPDVRRAVILMHGRLRNADAYFRLAEQARAAAGDDARDTLLIVPQFLATADVDAHRLDATTLHWDWTGWMGGDPALGPAPISSFDVLDAILRRLAQRDRFPALSTVVIAGHSGGGQVAQRYAVVTHGETQFTAHGIAVRYVIANPSSYVYFDALRPTADGAFITFDEARCPGFDDWKYGLNRLPAYALDAMRGGSAYALEAAYARRDVVLLLGGDDCDPAHPALDTSCAARAQGAHRLERGRAYARYMRMRHGDNLNHRVFEVAGMGHDGAGIFTSNAGLAALFDAPPAR